MRLARVTLALLLAVVTVAAGLVVAPSAERAEAAVASDFDPGYIISDEQFFDGLAMSGVQIQSFLDSQVRTCAAGYTCLKDYAQATPAMPASIYCDAMPQRSDQSAAAILYQVSRACDISPKVLLVLLQKEQSLVTLTAPSATRYARATGFACPDTAPCDASFGGFFYQIYYAARQFQRYAAHPTNYQHRAGQTNRVLYNPNAGCGSSQVFIRNQATAGLYNYTPYQPNAAALRNLYGTGDGCSAYGNRNFWRMWSDWFGSPTGVGPLVKVESTGEQYLIDGSTRYRFESASIASEYSRLGSVQTVSLAWLRSTTDGGQVGRVLRSGDGRTFFVDEGKRFQFASCAQMAAWGYACSGTTLSARILDALQDGGRLNDVVGWDGAWWRVSGGSRQEIGDTGVLGAAGLSYANSWLSPGAIDHLPIASPLLAPGWGVRDGGRTVGLMGGGNGSVVSLDQGQVRLSAFSSFAVVSSASLAAGRASASALPNRIDYGDSAWIVTDRGLLEVSKAQYGGDAFFTDLAYPFLRGMPQAGSTSTRDHFQAEVGSSTVWMITGGQRQPVAASQVASLASQRGLSPTIHRGAAGYLNWMPERSNFAPGTLLRDGISGQLLLTSRDVTIRVDSLAALGQLGLSTAPRTVTRSVRNGLPPIGPAITDPGVWCGSSTYLGSGGRAIGFTNPASRDAWGFTYEVLPADVCALLRPTGERTGPIVAAPDGGLWLIEGGVRRPIDSSRTADTLPGASAARATVSGTTLYLLPRGTMVTPYWYTGTHVQAHGASTSYLVDQGRLMQTNSTVMWELGLSHRPTAVPNEAIQVSNTTGSLRTTLVACGGISYAAVDQRLVRFPWRVAAEFGNDRFTEVSPTLCGKVRDSSQWMSPYIRDSNGQAWLVDGGTRTRVSSVPSGNYAPIVDQTILSAIPAR
ncbi:hypothetical protein OVA14_07730 [Agrococcus sp. SL85]|uniref:hypothetical protein n=1 Tax=Agrococcus sp. SL85 TaxID=2995141 RepID=UPI00226CAC3C|nr:hypothetical protein [Agrococcus sp. SL85]WAC65276.1 hypothetical protein OVA14_07730 [Agrococcus sp. SL85]